MTTEREHWLSITDDPDWKRNHIHDPAIDISEELAVLIAYFPKDPKRILEIGCGYGRLTEAVAEMHPEAKVMGFDINRKIMPSHGKAVYVCGDGDQIPSFSFDVIYSVAVFQHLDSDQKQAYIEQAAAALNPGGVLVVQFVQGDHDGFCDHLVPWSRMWEWSEKAGLKTEVGLGLVHVEWAWIVGVKP